MISLFFFDGYIGINVLGESQRYLDSCVNLHQTTTNQARGNHQHMDFRHNQDFLLASAHDSTKFRRCVGADSDRCSVEVVDRPWPPISAQTPSPILLGFGITEPSAYVGMQSCGPKRLFFESMQLQKSNHEVKCYCETQLNGRLRWTFVPRKSCCTFRAARHRTQTNYATP